MEVENTYKNIIGAYYGIREMDEYSLKVYVLKEIEDYVRKFIIENKIDNYNYKEVAEEVYSKTSLKTKLQDAMYLLNHIDPNQELLFLIKDRLRKMEKEEKTI